MIITEKIWLILRKGRPRELKQFLIEYDHYLSPLVMVLGFILDILTLKRADLWIDNLILLSYLALSSIAIVVYNAYLGGKIKRVFFEKLVLLAPLTIQFALGGLFSGFLVLYSRSALLWSSWPFLIILAALLVGNELVRERYQRLPFQTSLYFIAIFSYLIFAVPLAINRVGQLIFILSGICSIFLLILMLKIIKHVALAIFTEHKKETYNSVILIYIVFNVFYFSNIIPPIPLSLKDAIVAHDVKRVDPYTVRVSYEPAPWYLFWRDFDPTYHLVDNKSVYIFNSIFAPADINTDIVHQWEFYDKTRSKWITDSKIEYKITGGRSQGYRGFSLKTNLRPGKWRVNIETKNGQLLGRVKFTIEPSITEPNIISESR